MQALPKDEDGEGILMTDITMCANWPLCVASSECKRSPEVTRPSEHFQHWVAFEPCDDKPCEMFIGR